MTRERRNISGISPIKRNVTPVRNPAVKRKTTDKDGTPDTQESVEKQVAAIKKLPKERIAANRADDRLAEMNSRLQKTLKENQRLKALADSAKRETENLRRLTDNLKEEAAEAKKRVEASERLKDEAEKEAEKLQWKITVLDEKLEAIRDESLQEQSYQLDPDKAGYMLSKFRDLMSYSIAGLAVRDLELRLKVSAVKQGNNGMLILAATDKENNSPDRLSEFVIRMSPR